MSLTTLCHISVTPYGTSNPFIAEFQSE